MKVYRMVRAEDVSGVSGTGVVGEVAEFSDGTTVVRWLTEFRSTAIYANVADALRIHGHDGRTTFVQVYELVNKPKRADGLEQTCIGCSERISDCEARAVCSFARTRSVAEEL